LDPWQSKTSQAKSLEYHYSPERYEDFYLKLDKLIKVSTTNILAASIRAFASQQLDRADPYPFCKNPMEFICVYESLEGVDDANGLLSSHVDELKNRALFWNPHGKTTNDG
jgi:hypothetical protein